MPLKPPVIKRRLSWGVTGGVVVEVEVVVEEVPDISLSEKKKRN